MHEIPAQVQFLGLASNQSLSVWNGRAILSWPLGPGQHLHSQNPAQLPQLLGARWWACPSLPPLVTICRTIGWAIGPCSHLPWPGTAAHLLLHSAMVLLSSRPIRSLTDTHCRRHIADAHHVLSCPLVISSWLNSWLNSRLRGQFVY